MRVKLRQVKQIETEQMSLQCLSRDILQTFKHVIFFKNILYKIL